MSNISTQRESFRLFMEKNNLTAYKWAKKAGITEGTIRSFLRGRSNSLTYNTLNKLAQSVGVNPTDIISYSQEHSKTNSLINRALLAQCMKKVDNIIEQKKVQLSSEDRRKLYFAWYDIKVELKTHQQNQKLDDEKLNAMLKLVS